MIINKKEESGVMILEPDGRIDSLTVPELEQEIDKIGSGEDGHHLLIDFAKVDYISSAGLRVILKTVKERQVDPRGFAISRLQDHVREVFEISGFAAFISIHPDTAKAIASFS